MNAAEPHWPLLRLLRLGRSWGGLKVRAEICVASENGTDTLMSLFRWLNRDRDLRHVAQVSLDARGSAADMGAADIINMVFTQGISLVNLGLAYASWRDSRTRAPAITVTVDNRSVTLDGETGDGAQDLLLTLLGHAPSADGTGASSGGSQPDGPLPGRKES